MGLYDRVIIECTLPDDGAKVVKEWQTKDFAGPYMENYRITAEAALKACEADLDAAIPRLPKGFSDRDDYQRCVTLLERIRATINKAEPQGSQS